MTVCKWCYSPEDDMLEPLTVLNAGDEYWSFCPNCECVEPDTMQVEGEDDE
jgi:hypothetical protein